MLYCSAYPENIERLSEYSFDKTLYQAKSTLTRYSNGMAKYLADRFKVIMENGDEFILTNPLPISNSIDKTLEIEWSEFSLKEG